MKNRTLMRVFTIILCLCFFLSSVPAESSGTDTETNPNPDLPVTSANFTLSLNLHPEGFPQSTPLLRDWAVFLSKLSIQGHIDTLDRAFFLRQFGIGEFADITDTLQPYSRVYLNGGLYVNGKNRVPFIYDGYHNFRYIVSPAIRNQFIYFQMHNFFQFMLKPYYFMGLPTQYLALLLYPEATHYLGDSYYTTVADALAGDGTRIIPYDDLAELAEALNLFVVDDEYYERVNFFVTCLLVEWDGVDMVMDKLADLFCLLDFLDPEQEGMTITVTGSEETYVLGETTVFHKQQTGNVVSWTLTLPDPDGYLLTFTYKWTPADKGAMLTAQLVVTLEEEKILVAGVDGTGLPCAGDVSGLGRVVLTLDSPELSESVIQTFDFQWDTDRAGQPQRLAFNIDWLHPQTGAAALSFQCAADIRQVPETVFVEGTYKGREDFFTLNDSSLQELRERFLPTLALSFAPVVLEMPVSVLSSILQFVEETGILASLGV